MATKVTGQVKLAAASQKDREMMWALFHAADRCDNRDNGHSTHSLNEELQATELDRSHRLFLLRAFQLLVDNQSSYMRVLHGFEILFDNFCDPNASTLEVHPEVERLMDDGELLPVLLEAYGEAQARIAELEAQIKPTKVGIDITPAFGPLVRQVTIGEPVSRDCFECGRPMIQLEFDGNDNTGVSVLGCYCANVNGWKKDAE